MSSNQCIKNIVEAQARVVAAVKAAQHLSPQVVQDAEEVHEYLTRAFAEAHEAAHEVKQVDEEKQGARAEHADLQAEVRAGLAAYNEAVEDNGEMDAGDEDAEADVVESEDCPICAEPMSGEVTTMTCCNQKICTPCIEQWRESSDECPLCKHAHGGRHFALPLADNIAQTQGISVEEAEQEMAALGVVAENGPEPWFVEAVQGGRRENFVAFVQANRQRVREAHPHLTARQVTLELTRLYRLMPDDDANPDFIAFDPSIPENLPLSRPSFAVERSSECDSDEAFVPEPSESKDSEYEDSDSDDSLASLSRVAAAMDIEPVAVAEPVVAPEPEIVVAETTSEEEEEEDEEDVAELTKEEKAEQLIAAAATECMDLPPVDQLGANVANYAAIFDPDAGELKANDLVDALQTNHNFAVGKTSLYLVGAYNTAGYFDQFKTASGHKSDTAALKALKAKGVAISNANCTRFRQFKKAIDEVKAHKFLYGCASPWRDVRDLLPKNVLLNAFKQFQTDFPDDFTNFQ